MSSFTNLEVTVNQDGLFVTTEPFSFYRDKDTSECITVPAGTCTDFATVPRLLQVFFDRKDLFNAACVLHDYLYQTQYKPRKEADIILKEGMHVLGCSKGSIIAFYHGVRLFGWIYYNKQNK